MADLFPHMFGEDHQDQDAADATNFFVPPTSVVQPDNEQNVSDIPIKGNDDLVETEGGVVEDDGGFKRDINGTDGNSYQNNEAGENNGGVGEGVFPNDQMKENNDGGNESTLPNEETNNGGKENHDEAHDKSNRGVGENGNAEGKDGSVLVSPFESGEGLPYAPIDWPNPGDNWSWRVGRRINAAGFFQDRFLMPPKRLQEAIRGPKSFASVAAVTSYLRSHFQDPDVDDFFASFTWKIPGKQQSSTKGSASAPVEDPQDAVQRVLEELREEIPQTASGRPKRAAAMREPEPKPEPKPVEKPTPRTSGRKRKQVVNVEEPEPTEEETPRPAAKNRRQKASVTSPSAEKKSSTRKASLSAQNSQQSTRHSSRRQKETKPAATREVAPPPIPNIPEDFDNYLNSLEDIITQPPVQRPELFDHSNFAVDDMAEARSKLSSLLEMDFPSLISPKIISELTSLASRLRNDPFLNAEQLVMLKLIEEIPLYSEVYVESREIIAQVDEQFAIHEKNKLRVNSLKEEYSELKNKADQLQSQMDSSSMMVQEIDNEIARLQYQRRELVNMIESNKNAKEEITNTQKVVANTIPGIVQDIQAANSKVPEWVLKKTNASNREAQVLAKFAPLRGFSL